MTNLMLIITSYRTILVGMIALVLWFAAYYKYFRRYMQPYWNKSKPHSWSVDMVNKRTLRHGKPEVN